jgi:transcriptional regulator with XRE-family HTH domain
MTPLGLRRIRRALGLTQEELGKRIGVRRLAVTRWESGARGISEPIARLVQRVAAEARGKPRRKGGTR